MKKPFRIVAWTVGSLVVVFVALVVIGMSIDNREYVFRNGRSLQDNVSGRWDWSTRDKTCADSAHVIAFSEDGKVMTITHEFPVLDSAGRDDRVTTYDVVSLTTSRIRGAIRGETRLTADSQPVVWDLVVTGKDRYAWHRTDWQSWGLTAGNLRCPVPAMTDAMPETKPARTATAPLEVADYYRGTIVNNQLAESMVPLELFIFQRSDSSTSGWLRSGPPLNTTGLTAVVVSDTDKDSLYLVTYATTGDTIIWGSETRKGSIGGEYWVSSGAHPGQGGSWQLEPATRLSVTTLVMIAALIAGAALLGIFALASYGADWWWRWRDRQPLLVTDQQRANWSGVGGWLVWIIVMQSFVALILIARFRQIDETLGNGWMLGAAVGGFRPILLIESATHILQLLGLLAGIVLIVRKARMAPPYWMTFLLVLMVYAIFDIAATSVMENRMVALFGEEAMAESSSDTQSATRTNMRLVVAALLWSWYWARSRRVALVFGRQGTRAGSVPPAAGGDVAVRTDFSLTTAPDRAPQNR